MGLKKHEKGKCSKYLDNKTIESKIEARIVKNKRFHIPEEFDRLILIGNGTGIAPLLGIAYENFQRKRIDLFWGCKFKNTLKRRQNLIMVHSDYYIIVFKIIYKDSV